MNIAILGFGEQGKSAYNYWNTPDNQLTICDLDANTKVPEGVTAQLGPNYLSNLIHFDLIVRGPSVHPSDIVDANIPNILHKVTTVTDEFMRVCLSRNIIGVTGTKGKGTTSTLIAKMLEAAGKKVHLGGNIGIPPLDMLHKDIQKDDYVVLEIANFQLIDLHQSPHIGVCLMVVPEHLNWHKDMDEYVNSKAQLFSHQTSRDLAIYLAGNKYAEQIAQAGKGRKVPFFAAPGAVVEYGDIVIDGQLICRIDELKLLGEHNWQNVCAAVTAVWQITQDAVAMHSVLTTFSGLEHRLELVGAIDGASYYDDSFGTTPETAIVALKSFKEPKILILGGSDKNSYYDELAGVIAKSNVRRVILIGKTAPVIEASLTAAGFTAIVKGGADMDEIVKNASKHTQPGDIVLLSPACASFDMFNDYKDRGNQFKQAVSALSSGV